MGGSTDDIYNYEVIDKEFDRVCDYSHHSILPVASGQLFRLFLRQRIFKNPIRLPQFRVEIKTTDKKSPYVFTSPKLSVESEWVGETYLIGEHYHKILSHLETKLLCTGSLGVMCLFGTSGTGKTRLSKESIDRLLKHKYRILYFAHDSNVSSLNILREIVFFLYEIPRDDIIQELEKYTQNTHSEQVHEKVNVAFSIIRHFKEALTTEKFINAIDKYGDIIFEKLSYSTTAIIIDNIQFFKPEIKYFILQYINYALIQNRSNYSVFITTFNTDFLDSTSKALLDKIQNLEGQLKVRVLERELTGFENSEQSIMFLRQLMQIKNERYDHLLAVIAEKVSYKPFHLAQAVRHLDEKHSITTTMNDSVYPLEVEVLGQIIHEMPSKITEILKKRWEYFISTTNECEAAKIAISAMLLFGDFDESLISLLDIDKSIVNLLIERSFFRRELYTDRGTVVYFEHGIIESFFVTHYPNIIFAAVDYILHNNMINSLDKQTVPYALCIFKQDYSKVQFHKLQPILVKINVQKHIQNIFIKQWMQYLKDNLHTIDKLLLCKSFYDLCTRSNDFLGVMRSRQIYGEAISALEFYVDEFPDEVLEIYINIVNSYVDVLVKANRPNEAIDLLEDKLQIFMKRYSSASKSKVSDYLASNISRIYNRMQIAYRTIETEEARIKTWDVLKESKRYASQVKNMEVRCELEYLNYSDEGYCYYCYLKDKNKLIDIWKNWRKYKTSLPKKTLNMYRKQIQLLLIENKPLEALSTLSEGEEYLRTGRYVYERLAFKTFFAQARIAAMILKDPIASTPDISQALTTGLENELMMPSGRGDMFMQLAAIHAHYQMNAQAAHQGFMQSYIALQNNRYQHNYSGKMYLLSSNILYCYVLLGIHPNNDLDFSYWKSSQHYNLWHDLSKANIKVRDEFLNSWKAEGILQTIDGKINLPPV